MEIVKLRALYPEMEEATIGKWTAAPGDQVEFGDSVAEFITDKVAFEYTMEAEGRIEKILVADKSVVPVGTNLLILSDEPVDEAVLNALKQENETLLKAREEAISGLLAATGFGGESVKSEQKKQVRATPSARRMAKELGVNLEEVNGTGNNGIITEDDVKSAK